LDNQFNKDMFNNLMFHNNLMSNNLMFHNNLLSNKFQFNNQSKPKSSNNQDHKLNLILKTFQSKRLIQIMNKEWTMSKSHMKDNTLNKLPNKELNMSQLPEP